MTGFARAGGDDSAARWTWEARSVNARGLDVRVRVPQGFDALEPAAREAVGKRFQRGSIGLNLTIARTAAGTPLRINKALLDQLIALQAEYEGRIDAAPPRLDVLLGVRGVVEAADEEAEDEGERTAREAAVRATLDEAVAALAAMRAEEGRRLEAVILGHIDAIAGLTDEAEASAALRPEAVHARLAEQLKALMGAEPALPEERIAQEAALIAARGDVREELDRLKAHIQAARGMIGEGGAVGRRLDFLCQEFNREANTLCSKSSDVELTRIGLKLKAAIEQLREQVQNIE